MENALDIVKGAIFKEIVELIFFKKVCGSFFWSLNCFYFINYNVFHHQVDIITELTLFRRRLDSNSNYATQQLKNRIIAIKYYLLEPSLLDASSISAV